MGLHLALSEFMNSLQERVHQDWDVVIAVTGEEGVGKSTLAGNMSKKLDKRFDWIRNVAYMPTHKEVEDKFFALESYQVFLVDEAIKVLYKLKWADKLQIRINEMYATERWQNKITILCMPRFTDFNEMFRNHRIKIWIHVIERGVAVAFIKDDVNIFRQDPWHLKENSKIMEKLLKNKKITDLNTEDRITLLAKSMNFWFYFEFGNLAEDDERTYKEIKAQMRLVRDEYDPRIKEIITSRNEFLFWVHMKCYVEGLINKYVPVYDVKDYNDLYRKVGDKYTYARKRDLTEGAQLYKQNKVKGYVKIREKTIAKVLGLSEPAITRIIKTIRENKTTNITIEDFVPDEDAEIKREEDIPESLKSSED